MYTHKKKLPSKHSLMVKAYTNAVGCHARTMFTFTYFAFTYFMEQCPPWETNWFSASQEIPCILWNPMVHYHIHKCPRPIPILSHLKPVHTPTSHFLKIQLNIILPFRPGSPMWSHSLRFPHQNPVHTSPLPPFALHALPIAFFLILSP